MSKVSSSPSYSISRMPHSRTSWTKSKSTASSRTVAASIVCILLSHVMFHTFINFLSQTSTALSRRSSFTYEFILYGLYNVNSYFCRCSRTMSKRRTILLSSLVLCRSLNANWISGRQTAQSTYRALSRTRLTQYHATRSITPLLVRSRTLPVSPLTF